MSKLSRKQQTQKRHRRLRRHITGTPDRPRLAVFRSNTHIYAQVIDAAAQSPDDQIYFQFSSFSSHTTPHV